MVRKLRIAPTNYPQHIYNRGNNKSICFIDASDFKAFAAFLKKYTNQFDVQLHAWVFMTNHFHLLATPQTENAISKMMQGLGRDYAQYFNFKYNRTGTLWEGRFNSCLVDSESYLLQLYKYIEHNPVRAGMVSNAADYSWSSYQINGLGKESTLVCFHEYYLSLGTTKLSRLKAYNQFLEQPLTEFELNNIRQCVKSGNTLGSNKFKQRLSKLCGCELEPKKIGRPNKNKL
ncbi:transposase [Thalassotalea crassostreae]|uniref:transposase n=1 Tax=Thalassotalea crassostreae TaxID=1763536 RepID=UPI000838DCAD|nr:transposase [Thalassotalea crassostreae]